MSEAPPPPSQGKEPSLDEQIDRAEMQVVARDLRIRRRTDSLVRRVRHEAIRHAGGGLLLGVGSVALTWWLNRLSRRHAPPPPAAAAAPTEPPSTFEHLFRDAGLTLATLLPMLWPLLPRGWRRHVNPGTAGTLLTFLAPLLGRLVRRKSRRAQSS
jgi:hypothetical protein